MDYRFLLHGREITKFSIMILITAKGRQCHFDFFGVYLLYATYNISYHKHFDNGSSGEIEMIPSYVPILR